jgi:copper chaperone CopZ
MAALERVNGVRHVKVDGAEKRVVVTYDPAVASEGKLIGAITQLGYSAEVSSISTSPTRSWQEREP